MCVIDVRPSQHSAIFGERVIAVAGNIKKTRGEDAPWSPVLLTAGTVVVR
jgi:hypothetical protein